MTDRALAVTLRQAGSIPLEVSFTCAPGEVLAIFGRPHAHWLAAGWVRHEIAEAQASCPVPIVLVDADGEIRDEVVQRWKEHLHPREEAEGQELPPGNG